MQTSAASQPGDGPRILAPHGLAAPGTRRRVVSRRLGHNVDFALESCQYLRPILDLHFSLQQQEAWNLIGQTPAVWVARRAPDEAAAWAWVPSMAAMDQDGGMGEVAGFGRAPKVRR